MKEFKDIFAPEPELVHLRRRVKELESSRNRDKDITGQISEAISELGRQVKSARPVAVKYKPEKPGKSPCTHVLHITDWHYGGVVEEDEVDGFNAYSPDIARARAEKLTQAILDKTSVQRGGYNVPSLHVIGTGDDVAGDIHPELLATNAFPAPVQAVGCGYLIGGMLAAFAPHFDKISVDLVTLDNHGRMTLKNQAAQGGVNNWGYVVAEVARQHVRHLRNVSVSVHSKPSALVAVGPERYLAFHGHQIKGWAGKPYYGFDRRVAMEAVKRMGVPEQSFTKLLLGHFHHGMNGDNWLLGGSLSGTDAFDHSCGRHSRPHQTSWFVHPRHGEFDWTRWWL
jgi:hypothetical protein